jgi:hypothetical protein
LSVPVSKSEFDSDVDTGSWAEGELDGEAEDASDGSIVFVQAP